MFNTFEDWLIIGLFVCILKILFNRSTKIEKFNEHFVPNKISKIIYFYKDDKTIPLLNIPKHIDTDTVSVEALGNGYRMDNGLSLGPYSEYFQISKQNIINKRPLLVFLFNESMNLIDGKTERIVTNTRKRNLNESTKYVKYIKIRLNSFNPIKFADLNNKNSRIEWSCFSQKESPYIINDKGIFFIDQKTNNSNPNAGLNECDTTYNINDYDYESNIIRCYNLNFKSNSYDALRCKRINDISYTNGDISIDQYLNNVKECNKSNDNFSDPFLENDPQKCRKMINSHTDSESDLSNSKYKLVKSEDENSIPRKFSRETGFI